jgi:hypothetical protein
MRLISFQTSTLGLFLCIAGPAFAQCAQLFDRYDTLVIGAPGSGYALTAAAGEGSFSAMIDASWFSVSKNGALITITSIQNNDTPGQRIGHITVSQSETCAETLVVVQPGKNCLRGIDGTQGRKFWAAFLENRYPPSSSNTLTTELVIASLDGAAGTITNSYAGWTRHFTVPAKGIHTESIPPAYAYNTDGEIIAEKAIYIETSADVSVYAANFQYTTSDAAVILPVEALGDEYYSLSFNGNAGSGTDDRTPEEFLIVATENNTLVTIVPKSKTGGARPAGNPYTIRLNRGQSYLVKSDITGATDSQSNYVSITGTYIKSNRLIAVFAGHKRAHVGCSGTNQRDHLFEQLLPLRLWGTQYLVVPTHLTEDLYRVLAAHDNTQFTVNGAAPITLNRGEYRDFSISSTQVAFIDADKPVSVALFAKSMSCTNESIGDPFMLVLNPVQNMTRELTFSPLPTTNIRDHYVNITVKKQSKALTRLVNENTGQPVTLTFTDIPSRDYAYARVRITTAVPHSLKNEAGFTAYAYGAGNADSYGYLVGARFNHLQEPDMVRDTSYCVGETPQPLSVFEGNDLLWYTSDDFEHEQGSPVAPVFSTASPATYTYYVSYLKECSESPRKKVTIIVEYPPDDPVITSPRSPSSTSFCAGEYEVLTAQSAGAEIFEWYKDDQRITGASGTTLTITESGTYHAKVASEHLCYAFNPSNLFEVTAHELPGAPDISHTSICKNDLIPIVPAAPSGYTFLWHDGNNQPISNPPLQSSATGATTYYARQKDNATGCEGVAAATWVYTVHDLPDISISGSPYFCENHSTELTASGAVAYLWSTGAMSASITVNEVNTYSVTGTDHNGCKNTDQITTSEKPLPFVKIALQDTTTVCHGTSLWLTPLGSAIGTVTWNVASPVTIDHTQHIIATATNECGSLSDSALVIHVPLPAVVPMDPLRTCEHNEITLAVKSATGDVHWDVPNTTFTAVASNTYTVYATNLCGAASQTVQVTVVPLPRVVANNDTTVCSGREVTLGTQQHIGTLSWDSPLTVKVTGLQTYTVTASNECGTASDEMTVDIFAPVRFTVSNPLPPYKYKKFYEQELSFENAEQPIYLRWLGTLPEGMTITPNGILRGMPMVTGYNFNSHRFTLFLEDGHGCTVSQEFLLPPLFSAPNAIIRDGGENAHFLPDFDLEIYNRQGILLYKGHGWLGASGASQVPPGTYFYKVTFMQDGEQRQHMGYITVLQ